MEARSVSFLSSSAPRVSTFFLEGGLVLVELLNELVELFEIARQVLLPLLELGEGVGVVRPCDDDVMVSNSILQDLPKEPPCWKSSFTKFL